MYHYWWHAYILNEVKEWRSERTRRGPIRCSVIGALTIRFGPQRSQSTSGGKRQGMRVQNCSLFIRLQSTESRALTERERERERHYHLLLSVQQKRCTKSKKRQKCSHWKHSAPASAIIPKWPTAPQTPPIIASNGLQMKSSRTLLAHYYLLQIH